MEQPVPKVTDDDVERIAVRDFGRDPLSQVLEILQEYGKQEWNRPGSPRVRLAILKLANGNLDQLKRFTNSAIGDFRDVVSQAEYPRYSAEIGFDRVAAKVERSVIDHDWKQYCEWLERK
jgi:hypothetical protein